MSYDIRKWHANEAQRRPRRRHAAWFIGAALLLPIGVAIAEMFAGNDGDQRFSTFMPAWLPVFLAIILSPFARDTWLTSRGRAVYDEFERDALDRATARAYGTFLASVALLFTWLWLASINGWPMPRTPLDWSAWGFALLAEGACLPIVFAEAMVPFPPAGDDLED